MTTTTAHPFPEVTEVGFADLATLSVLRMGSAVEVHTDGETLESDWLKVCDRLVPSGLEVTEETWADGVVIFTWSPRQN